MTTVVTILPSRLEELAELGAGFFAEGKLPGRFDVATFVRSWTALLSARNGEIFGLERNGELIGALGALLCPDINDGRLVATEAFWYVQPNERGAGIMLFNAYEKWAREAGCGRLMMVHLLGLAPEVMEKIYLRRGYKPVEVHYVKEFPHV